MNTIYKQTVDFLSPGKGQRMYAVQDDRFCRELELTLTAGGIPWTIPGDVGILVRFRKSDGLGGVYNTLPDGEQAWRASGNVLTVCLAPQVLTAAGLTQVEVSLIQADAQITTFRMEVQVEPSLSFKGTSGPYANVMSVGSVEALAPGMAPTAVISGTAEHPVLHLGLPCEGPSTKEITYEEVVDGYWNGQDVLVRVEGVYGTRTGLIPVKLGEAFLYTGFGAEFAPSALWLDGMGNPLGTEHYDAETGVRMLRVPDNAEFVRFYSHCYDGASKKAVLSVEYLPGGDDRQVVYEAKDGGYWDVAGAWVESSGGSRRTNFLQVGREDRIRYTGYGRWSAASVIWYGEDGGIVAAEMFCQEEHNRWTSVTVLPPDGAAYARFCSWDAGDGNMVVLNVSLEGQARQLERFKSSNVLFGKKYAACGDGFTQGGFGVDTPDWDPVRRCGKSYPWHIADRNTMVLANQPERGMMAFGEGAYRQIPVDADYVTLCFAEGDLSAELGSLDDSTSQTVLGAWNVVLEWLLTNLPDARIGILIPPVDISQALTDAIVSVAQRWGIPCLDLKNDPGVPLLAGGRDEGICETAVRLRNAALMTDGKVNGKGQARYSTVVEQFLRGL